MNFLPSQASTFAVETDAIFLALLGLTVFFTSLVFGLIGYFCWRYRAGRVADRTSPPHGNRKLESGLTVVLLLLSLVVFFWAATHYVRLFDVPDDAEPIFVVGRQWMWQAYHRNGRRELNQLHLSSKKPVRLYLVSEDVIHSFFVPAFRIKIDVLPGRYTQVWFEPTRPGRYRLYCAEYCGTNHSAMLGEVVVLPTEEFVQWATSPPSAESIRVRGERILQQLGCEGCHTNHLNSRAPMLGGLSGSIVSLADGTNVRADRSYFRRAILEPDRQIVSGYPAIMPSYQGRIQEEELAILITYLESLEPLDE